MAGYCTLVLYFHLPAAHENTAAYSCNIQPYCILTHQIIYNYTVTHTISHIHRAYCIAQNVCRDLNIVVLKEFNIHKYIFATCICEYASYQHVSATLLCSNLRPESVSGLTLEILCEASKESWVSPQKMAWIRNTQRQYVLNRGSHTHKKVCVLQSMQLSVGLLKQCTTWNNQSQNPLPICWRSSTHV